MKELFLSYEETGWHPPSSPGLNVSAHHAGASDQHHSFTGRAEAATRRVWAGGLPPRPSKDSGVLDPVQNTLGWP